MVMDSKRADEIAHRIPLYGVYAGLGNESPKRREETYLLITRSLLEYGKECIYKDRESRTADELYKASYGRGYKEGAEAMREKSAKVGDQHCLNGDTCNAEALNCRSCKIAKAIRALELKENIEGRYCQPQDAENIVPIEK